MGIMAGPDLQAFLHATTSAKAFVHAGWRVTFHLFDLFSHRHGMPAAWCPVSLVPYRSGRVGTYPHIVDRGKPGVIGVLSTGRRFVNEADGYYQYTTAMIRSAPEGEEVASWLICVHTFQRRYPFGMAKPFPVPTWPYVRSGYLTKASTLEELTSAPSPAAKPTHSPESSTRPASRSPACMSPAATRPT